MMLQISRSSFIFVKGQNQVYEIFDIFLKYHECFNFQVSI